MKKHSKGWFEEHQRKVREEIATWPKWMRDSMHWAAATFPVHETGDDRANAPSSEEQS